MPRHVRKGDEVMVTSGNFRGSIGTIVRVLTKAERAVVQFAPSVYDGAKRKQRVKALRPTRINPQGGQVALDRSFHLSNLSPVVEGKPTRVRFEATSDGGKARVAARGGKSLNVIHGPREGAAKTAKKTTRKKTTKKKTAKAGEA
jgi:large subunit ribosomal protein L24